MGATRRRCVLLAAAILSPWCTARANLMLVPPGLRPGDQFRVVFVSSASRNAASSDIADYDRFITNLAVSAGIDTYFGAPITWQALGSTATVVANSRLPASATSPAFYRLDGALVATSTGDLWDGSLSNPINVTETGVAAPPFALAWTGTSPNGNIQALDPLGGALVQEGITSATDGS
jgi:hypothetical protein